MSPSVLPAQPLPVTTPESAICESCSTELEKEMPSTLTLSVNPKDVRAYEHDRQRVKKATERVLMKARKERGWTTRKGATYDKTKCSCCQSDKRRHLGSQDVRTLLDGDVVGDVAFLKPRRLRSDSGSIQGFLPFNGTATATREVKLADLVTAGKPKRGKDGDFEVIPHVRSVIVLEDFSGDEKDVEEPWEYVQGDDFDEKVNGLSYAEIVAITR